MEPRCRHHADRSAVGACCYCERPLCGECLCANRQGRSYCRNEEDCLAYQEAQAPTENRIPPILRVLLDESALEDQVERLSECLEELEEMESVFEDSIVPNRTLQGGTPPPSSDVRGAHERIAAFCAAALLGEAQSLFNLLSLTLRHMETLREKTLQVPHERREEIAAHLESEAKPTLLRLRERFGQHAALGPEALDATLKQLKAEQDSTPTRTGEGHVE